MNDAIHHFVLLVVAVGFSATGWFMARNPLRVYRAFTFGNNLGNKFLVGFCGIVGMVLRGRFHRRGTDVCHPHSSRFDPVEPDYPVLQRQ
jgi:hypothetical protein